MSRFVISGATGLVGRFIVERFLRGGHDVWNMGRKAPPEGFFSRAVRWTAGDLDPTNHGAVSFEGADYFIHCAFSHVPGKYRGGEGDDPREFCRLNIDGSLGLFKAAKAAGVKRSVFLSSRAVYDGIPLGHQLTEEVPVSPSSLYGQIKHEVELGLAALEGKDFLPMSVRATGVYGPPGPGQRHKWADLAGAFEKGDVIASRVGAEVHGDDLATAVSLLLAHDEQALRAFGVAPVFNVSDIVLDRRELLAAFARRQNMDATLPSSADASALSVMDCTRLKSLGWSPRGRLDLTGF